MHDIDAGNWSKLSHAERIEFCIEAARQAEADALAAEPHGKKLYQDLAARWRWLAVEIERKHGPSQKTSRRISD